MILKFGTRVFRASWEMRCQARVARFIARRRSPKMTDAHSWNRRAARSTQAGIVLVALERKEDRRIVGDCGLKTFEIDNRLAQIGSTLGSNIGIKIRYRSGPRFDRMRLPQLPHSPHHCVCRTGAVRVLEESGFVRETHFRQSEWFKDAWVDDAIYALLSARAGLRQRSEYSN